MSDQQPDRAPFEEPATAEHERAAAPVPASPPRNGLVRKLAIAGSAAVLAVGVGLGIAGVGTGGGNATATAASAAPSGAAPQGAAGRGRGMDVSALATKLGVSETKLQAALQADRPTQGSGTRPSTATMAASLAKRLGLDEAKVTAALAATMPSAPSGGAGGAPTGTPPSGATPS